MMDYSNEAEACAKDPSKNIDWSYEFSAPKYHDFTCEESEAVILAAERWFDIAIPCEASPHVSKTNSIAELRSTAMGKNHGSKLEALQILAHVSPLPANRHAFKDAEELSAGCEEEFNQKIEDCEGNTDMSYEVPSTKCLQGEPCTPVGRAITGAIENTINRTPPSALAALVISPGSLPAKRLYSDAWKEASPLEQEPRSLSKKRNSSRGGVKISTKKKPIFASSKRGNRAEKKQKLEGGKPQQISYMKDRLPRPKNLLTLTVPDKFQLRTETRAPIHHEDSNKSSPFISMAERVRRFHMKSSKRIHIPSMNGGTQQEKMHDNSKGRPKLTVAKSPAFGTSQRVRPPKVKSAAELEEEMLAKMPKFKARPLPKKILQAPVLLTFTKSTPQVQEFQEFHLHTMERAQHHASSSSILSADSLSTSQNVPKVTKEISKPRPPQFETANRARPSTVKSREELEEEELAKIPKFKARELNKMIFESKDDLGLYRNQKREVTVPQEFHFKTDERAHTRDPDVLVDQILKLSLSKPNEKDAKLRPTIPKPFRLATDDRGLAKEMREIQVRIQQQQEEVKARIPIAHPLPWTTEFPEVPPKPLPKECTKPEPFYLESLLLHKQEQERMMRQQMQAEQLETALREFRAQPILSNAQSVLPEKRRKPLTVIEDFHLNVEQRAMERAEFEKMVAEKQKQYKAYLEKYEAGRKAEEERFLKAMRKEMVPTARPVPAFPRPRLPLRSTKVPTKPVSPQFSRKPLLLER
ncbi:protein TPX2 isoform X1 [Physcomitrium patens]|uniref:protein TPX2 isoform X1 n=1 Tax=Physcomitrium patens TaxID=3218 RepID=UPI000D162282|nr:protein TPX2-like isoform X1 [Physcomitrium patens]XP_024377436.1 protein TPX2-like isoform X1 [Physcomitrium patens]XP_024377445.1 protein TPX2-like isoform X1 [Physcomitrium patens]XP_024377453.1 protein TPX2-like isoform X1 [Physcomitrium patens]XP_024377462.1 protein TPX2-like isoform X1 [Physcomitrium patens]|eukprot:XP_024377428.1 protein TPX2-like isoform X1 [Physcomitrella patens]